VSGTLSHADITTLLASIGVLLAAARVLGETARRLGQPAVLGEILAGVLLGETVLGRLWPDASASLFPSSGPVAVALSGITTVGIVLFLMVAGLEVDLSTIWRRRKAALSVGALGMAVPFVIGLAPALAAPALLGMPDGGRPVIFALFLATAFSITALPVIAKVLIDLQLFKTDLGMTVIAAAVLNDLIGWLLFAGILASIGTGTGAPLPLPAVLLLTLAFAGLMLTLGRWSINRVLPWVQAHTAWPGGVIGLTVVLALLAGALTEWLGVHAILGAFFVGVAIGDSPHLRERTRGVIDHFVSFIFAPLFFATIALRIDFVAGFSPLLVAIVLALATLGKLLGCVPTARWCGFSRSESWAIGFGMNARGAMEIILGVLALQAGIIGEDLFIALVVMALATSAGAGTAIRRVMAGELPKRLTDYLTARTFVPGLTASDRREAIERLADAIAPSAVVTGGASALTPGVIAEAVLAREAVMGSGLGKALAVPHARIPGLKAPVMALGTLKKPVDFDARDGTPARVVILLLTPAEQPAEHVKILGLLARTLSDQKRIDRVAASGGWTELLAALRAEAE
jgi:Kef-type K+ transport system membrane component KefB